MPVFSVSLRALRDLCGEVCMPRISLDGDCSSSHAEPFMRKEKKGEKKLEKRLKKEIIRRYERHLSRYKASYYRKVGLDLVMGRREGIYFWDLAGKRYINCHCNGGVFNLGHRHPRVVSALQSALGEYDIGNHHLISGPRSLLAERLSDSFANGRGKSELSRVVFGASGGEAADLAIKLARGYTGRQKIVSLAGGYHGHTGLAAATGDEKYRNPFALHLPDFVQVAFGDMAAMRKQIQGSAGVILETVPATLGMPIFPAQQMREIRQLCDRYGVVMIMDEIQTGLGRTGKVWAYQHYDIVPDIVISGKGLSGGMYPISATCYREKFEQVFKKDPFIHISTFGGAEVGCSAALTVLDIVGDADFLKRIETSGLFFEQRWNELSGRFPEITEVRRLGMFMGIRMRSPEDCLILVRTLLDNGIFAVYANNDKRVLQFLPPLIVSESEREEIMQIVETSLKDKSRLKYRLLKAVLKKMLQN